MTAVSGVEAYRHFMNQKRFGSLDGLRALSIIGVIWTHTAPADFSRAVVGAGSHGVTLFFAISGFLITTLLLRERQRNGFIDLRAFYIRRSLRIFPLYYLTLCVYVLLVAAFEQRSEVGQDFFQNLPFFATYTSNIFVPLDGRVIFYFSWSLAAEEQFYLLWPVLLTQLNSSIKAATLLVTLIALCIVGQLEHQAFLSRIPVAILTGTLFAILLDDEYCFQRLYGIFTHAWTQPLVVVLLATSLLTQQSLGFFNSLLCAVLVVTCVIREQHLLSPLLKLRWAVYIGSISYGMYLLHMLSKNFVLRLLHFSHLPVEGLHIFVLTLLVATGAATLSFRYFESVFIGMKLRYAC